MLIRDGISCGVVGRIARRVGFDIRDVGPSIEREGWSAFAGRFIDEFRRQFEKKGLYRGLRSILQRGLKLMKGANIFATMVATACKR